SAQMAAASDRLDPSTPTTTPCFFLVGFAGRPLSAFTFLAGSWNCSVMAVFPPYGHFASEERMRSSYFHSNAEVQADKPFYGCSCRKSSGVSDGGVPAIKFAVAAPNFA